MGVAEGSFCPTSFAATADASHPRRRGLNLGLQQSGFALFGLALSPIIATQLLNVDLTGYLALGTQKIGLVVSAIGFGGFLGQFGLPGLSDIVGRRPASIVGFAGTAVMLYIFRNLGAQPLALFSVLFVASFFTLRLVSESQVVFHRIRFIDLHWRSRPTAVVSAQIQVVALAFRLGLVGPRRCSGAHGGPHPRRFLRVDARPALAVRQRRGGLVHDVATGQ